MISVLEFAIEEWSRLAAACGLPETYNAALHVDPELIPETEGDLDDAYTIDSDEQGVVIIASNERSALQGVYRFFYLLGARYLAPGTAFETYPDAIDPELFRQHETVIPPLRHRGVCIEGADSVENIVDLIDWLPKIGMNSFFVQFWTPFTFLQRWYEHIGNPLVPHDKLSMEQALIYSQRVDEAMEQRGILHHRVGHGWTGAVLGTDAQGWDVQDGTITPEQERLCAEINGKRGFFHGIPLETNLCYSNPEVRAAVAGTVVDYAKEHPEVHYLHLWLADSLNSACECENCRKQSPSDHYIDLLNEIDERLTEEGLSTRIVFLLYLELLWAPVQKKLYDPERFVLMFAPISRSFNSSYEDVKEIPKTPEFVLNHVKLPVDLEANLAFLKDWQRKWDGDSFVYDYHLGRAHFGDLGYAHISQIIYRDIRFLAQLDLRGQISCQELRAGLPNFLPNYVMGMAGAHGDLEFEEIQEDYYAHCYGEDNWEDVRDYLEALSALSDCDYFNRKGDRVDPVFCADMKQLQAIVRNFRPEIEKMHSEDPLQQRFLEVLRYHSEYCELYAESMIQCSQGDDPREACEAVLNFVRTNEPQFQEFFDVYRIDELLPKTLNLV